MPRTITLRLFGIAVAVIGAATAFQLFAYSLDIENGGIASAFSAISRAFSSSMSEGGSMLLGTALIAVAVGAAIVVVRPERTNLIRLGKESFGRAYLEPQSLARSVQRSLRESVHPQIAVTAKGSRLIATAPYRSSTDPLELVDEVAAEMPLELENRGVPSLKFRVGVGRPAKRRVR